MPKTKTEPRAFGTPANLVAGFYWVESLWCHAATVGLWNGRFWILCDRHSPRNEPSDVRILSDKLSVFDAPGYIGHSPVIVPTYPGKSDDTFTDMVAFNKASQQDEIRIIAQEIMP